jgi:hypothetical protein
MHTLNSNPPTTVKKISGRLLAQKLRRGEIKPEHRARLAEDWRTGRLHVTAPTSAQSRRFMGATVADVAAERRLAREQRRRDGRLNDADVDRIVERVGADKVLAAIDRLTRPHCQKTGELFGTQSVPAE